jgi:hypothetical protein
MGQVSALAQVEFAIRFRCEEWYQSTALLPPLEQEVWPGRLQRLSQLQV